MVSTRSKWIGIAIVIFTVAVVGWLLHRTDASDASAVDVVAETADATTEATTTTAPIEKAKAPEAGMTDPTAAATANLNAPSEISFKKALQQCWGGFTAGPMSEASDITSLMHAMDQEDSQNSLTVFENYHINTNEGERRLQVLFQDNQPSQLRFFDVDEEDLPVPVSPEDGDKRPIDQTLQDFLRKGTQTFHQIRRELSLKNGLTAEVETINDQPSELQLHGLPGGTLLCAKDNCRCLVFTTPVEDSIPGGADDAIDDATDDSP